MKIDYAIATSRQIEADLCKRIQKIRLARNITQAQLASEAGVSASTIYRLENGIKVSFDTFIRVLIAFGLQSTLQLVLPDPEIRPIERASRAGIERQRARGKDTDDEKTPWKWGDEKDE